MAPYASTPWTLALGPGPRLGEIRPLLEALRGAEGAPFVATVDDLLDLLEGDTGLGRALLDVDTLPMEDLGILRRASESGLDLVLVGGDPTGALVRRLQRERGVRWLPWPLDTDALHALLDTPSSMQEPADGWRAEPAPRSHQDLQPGPSSEPTPDIDGEPDFVPSAPPPEAEPVREPHGILEPRPARAAELEPVGDLPPAPAFPGDPELEAIEAILGKPGPALTAKTRAERSVAMEREPAPDPFDTEDPEAFLSARDPVQLSSEEIEAFTAEPLEDVEPVDALPIEDLLAPGEDPSSPEPVFEVPTPAEVEALAAELARLDAPPTGGAPPAWYRDQVADLADQAQRLELGLKLAREMDDEQALERVQVDVAGLLQFTRTLGFLAAPPAPGDQEFDLGVFVEEQLAGLLGASESMPRVLYQNDPSARVRADKQLVLLAMDAVLQVAARCAGPDGILRASIQPGPRVRIDFPVGPLAELPGEPDSWLEPYALHRTLEGIGPNALAAADRILSGQGGRLALGRIEDAQLRFEIELPPAPDDSPGA